MNESRRISENELLEFLQDSFPDEWEAFVDAVIAARGMDTDFAEDNHDGPVGRLHIAQARLTNILRKEFPHLTRNRMTIPSVIDRAHKILSDKGTE